MARDVYDVKTGEMNYHDDGVVDANRKMTRINVKYVSTIWCQLDMRNEIEKRDFSSGIKQWGDL